MPTLPPPCIHLVKRVFVHILVSMASIIMHEKQTILRLPPIIIQKTGRSRLPPTSPSSGRAEKDRHSHLYPAEVANLPGMEHRLFLPHRPLCRPGRRMERGGQCPLLLVSSARELIRFSSDMFPPRVIRRWMQRSHL